MGCRRPWGGGFGDEPGTRCESRVCAGPREEKEGSCCARNP
ncbi:unnamed protein product [Gulo gulo]|uniref:Uncharacterized protein n=1 Tax=Gulo gulo TaxID=48420 RepID=A0A9X9PYR9_GULGU|nr:unnamed protein product [Gulo gulo]